MICTLGFIISRRQTAAASKTTVLIEENGTAAPYLDQSSFLRVKSLYKY